MNPKERLYKSVVASLQTAKVAPWFSVFTLLAALLTFEPAVAANAPINDGTGRVTVEVADKLGGGGYGGGVVGGSSLNSTGGLSNSTGGGVDGYNGAVAGVSGGGGGGGGAGETGASGGAGAGSGGTGGAGGSAVGNRDGDDGIDGTADGGGGGGGGGAHGSVVAASGEVNTGTIQGGDGGRGGSGFGAGAGGGGGAGGYGVVINDSSGSYGNTGTIKGGRGGGGGNSAATSVGEGGYGGNGLFVIDGDYAVTNANTGIIAGGGGGDSGGGSTTNISYPEGSNGGNGIVFSGNGSTLTNSGSVSGGAGGSVVNSPGELWPLAGNGGAGVWGEDFSIINTDTGIIKGGDGGDGGGRYSLGSAKGGYGGYGVIYTGNITGEIINNGQILGGDGGIGTTFTASNVNGGGAGGIGIGASNLTIINNTGATIAGGNGGAAKVPLGSQGQGGAGIVGSDLTIYTSGAIIGGVGVHELTHMFDQANAITFTGGDNYLELRPGFTMIGNVVVEAGVGTLALGGAGSGTFKVSMIDPNEEYQGFTAFEKTGTGTWTLAESPMAQTPWTIKQGVLQISENNSLGVSSELLTFDSTNITDLNPAPTLRFIGQDITLDRDVALVTDGVFDTFGNTATISGDIGGTGGLVKTGAGSLILSGDNDYDGDTFVNAGALVAGKQDVFAAASLHTISSGATLDLAGFDQTIADVYNAGTIVTNGTLMFGVPDSGARLTVTSSYIGAGGTLELNTYLGDDSSPSDRLVIDGGDATGNSFLQINNAGGPGALTIGDGIKVVDAINGGTTEEAAFALSGRKVAGPYEYSLFRGGLVADPANENSWFLRSSLIDDPETPHYREETSIYTALPSMALLYGRNLIGTLHERVGEEEDIRGRSDLHEKTPKTGAWGRVFGTFGKHDGHKYGIYGSSPKYKYDFIGLQAGHDLFRSEHDNGSRDHIGVYFAYGHTDGTVTHFDGARGSNKFDAYTLGGYWTRFGESGWYIDTVLQGTYYNTTSYANAGGLKDLNTHGAGLAISVEGGKPFRFDKGWFIEPQAQLVYQIIDISSANDTAAQIVFKDVDSLVGRVGVRIGRTATLEEKRQFAIWVRPNIWREFRGNPVTKFSSADGPVSFRADTGGTVGEIDVEASGQLSPAFTLYANASYNARFDGNGYGYGGRAGFRINW